jgi:hypothetical protein
MFAVAQARHADPKRCTVTVLSISTRSNREHAWQFSSVRKETLQLSELAVVAGIFGG